MSKTFQGLFQENKIKDYQGICDREQENGPIENPYDDDLIKEYNAARPCLKEYSIFKMTLPRKSDFPPNYRADCSWSVSFHSNFFP